MKKNKYKAALMAFLGGIIGMHKFYLRDPGAGIFYLILFSISVNVIGFPITMILGALDALNLIGMSEERFDRKYNKNFRGREPRGRSRRATRRRSREENARARREADRGRYVVKKQPVRKRSNPFKKTAYKKYQEFDLEDAILDYKEALEIAPDDKEVHFYMSAIYSLLEKKDKSFFHLEKAVSLGLKQTNRIMEMDDFAFLRIQDEFESFKNNGFRKGVTQKPNEPNEDLAMDDLLLSRLNKLKEMRERGLLSENEFLKEKEKIIRR